MPESENNVNHSFTEKVWITVSIVALFVILVWIIKATFNAFLLILAGVLIALYFHGLSSLMRNKLSIPKKISLPVAIIGSFLLLILFFWFAGDRIQAQADGLTETLPAAYENFKDRVAGHPMGKKLIDNIPSPDSGKATSTLKTFFSTTFGVLGDLYVVIFLGIFFISSPKIYTNGILKLVPPNGKTKAAEVLDSLGYTLTKWLKGQIFSMTVVFVLTAIGLLIIGVPLWLVLSLLAGLLSFVPNFGPLIAIIPAVLIGFMESSTTALLVLGLYMLVQILESNLITPKIQKKLINMPPALIIIAQIFMGLLSGGWGLVLATPIVAILIVVLDKLYIKNQSQHASQK